MSLVAKRKGKKKKEKDLRKVNPPLQLPPFPEEDLFSTTRMDPKGVTSPPQFPPFLEDDLEFQDLVNALQKKEKTKTASFQFIKKEDQSPHVQVFWNINLLMFPNLCEIRSGKGITIRNNPRKWWMVACATIGL